MSNCHLTVVRPFTPQLVIDCRTSDVTCRSTHTLDNAHVGFFSSCTRKIIFTETGLSGLQHSRDVVSGSGLKHRANAEASLRIGKYRHATDKSHACRQKAKSVCVFTTWHARKLTRPHGMATFASSTRCRLDAAADNSRPDIQTSSQCVFLARNMHALNSRKTT